MSVQAVARPAPARADSSRAPHRFRLAVGLFLSAVLFLSLAAYGLDYYLLDVADRPHSPKHHLLRPSGPIGLKLGMLGVLLFLGLYLYPIRKRWPWLGRQGNSRHWLDVHVLLGCVAPFAVAFHSAFKFRGLAGVAFWIMTAVAVSGLVGRYLYAQIPRNLSAAELSLREVEEFRARSAEVLRAQRLFTSAQLAPLFRLPEPAEVARMGLWPALARMIAIDLARPFRIAALRRRVLSSLHILLSLGGLLRTNHLQLEDVIRTACRQAALSKRILFLSRAQRVFHLWHVVHRPFSYSFSILAAIHVLVVLLFGFV